MCMKCTLIFQFHKGAIETHQGSVLGVFNPCFNPRAHVERDSKVREITSNVGRFNPRAHVGRDRVFSKCLNITVQSYEKCERFCGLMVK